MQPNDQRFPEISSTLLLPPFPPPAEAANGLSGQCPLITSPICTLIRSSVVVVVGEASPLHQLSRGGRQYPLSLEELVTGLVLIYEWIAQIALRKWTQSVFKHKTHQTY